MNEFRQFEDHQTLIPIRVGLGFYFFEFRYYLGFAICSLVFDLTAMPGDGHYCGRSKMHPTHLS
jgi:hypothetical protein